MASIWITEDFAETAAGTVTQRKLNNFDEVWIESFNSEMRCAASFIA